MKEDLGKLLLRLGIGFLMLFHGADKVLHGTTFIEGVLGAQGLPAFIVYGVYIGEIVAPIMIILGWQTRIAGAILAFNMLTAIVLVHAKDIFSLGGHGAWSIEVPMLYLIGGIVIALIGSGRYSLEGRRENGF